MKKTAGLVALSVLASLALSACGAGATAGSDGNAESAKLTYAVWDKNQAVVVEDLVKDFTAVNPGITVNVEVTPYKQYFTKLQTQASSGTEPDIYWMTGSNFKLYASNGLLAPLSELPSGGNIDPANYPKALNDLYTYEGKQYGAPKDFDTVALWYNKEIFDKAGLKYPTNDWTWDEFTTSAKTISDKLHGEGIYGTAWEMSDGQGSYYNAIPQAGGHVISQDKTKSGYDDPKTIKGIDMIATTMANGSSPSIEQLTDTSGDKWFASGKAGMIYSESYMAPGYVQSPNKEKFGIVHLPKDEQKANVINGLANVVSKDSKNKAAAAKFLGFLSSKEAALVWAKSGAVIPAFNGTQKQWIEAYPKAWDMQVFLDAADYAVPFPVSTNTAEWAKIEGEMLSQVWTGKKTAAEVGPELATAMNAVLAKE